MALVGHLPVYSWIFSVSVKLELVFSSTGHLWRWFLLSYLANRGRIMFFFLVLSNINWKTTNDASDHIYYTYTSKELKITTRKASFQLQTP